ncbi:MAG: Hint domain-containing protein [Rhodobacter sp.]|nr:Hint domain-containing protein [Rhodobacter sp.]
MPATLYDTLRIDPAQPFVADGSTVNAYKQSMLTKVEPVTVSTTTPGEFSAGDTFNGVLIQDVGKASLTITYNGGSSSTTITGYFVTLTSGETYLLPPDGASYPAITEISAVAEVGKRITVSDVDDDETVTIACFTAGTLIDTAEGPTAIEDIAQGARIVTRDAGLQRVRWIGATETLAVGAARPVRIAAGALGNAGALTVSPQHRLLWSDWRAELLFGAPEVLVKAKDLVGQPGIDWCPTRGIVAYWHLLFDAHHLVLSNGLWSESFQPGARTGAQLPGPAGAARAMQAARPDLKPHEVQVLLSYGMPMPLAQPAPFSALAA